MKTTKILIVSFAGLVGLLVMAALVLGWLYTRGLYQPEGDTPETIWITGGTLFTGEGSGPANNPGLLLRSGRITCIGEDCDVSPPALEIDARDLAILPGMIDLHTHFFGRAEMPGLVKLIWSTLQMRPDYRRRMLEQGVTSLRSVGDPGEAIFEIRRMLAQGEIEGPRLFIAGPIFTAPGGHPAYGGDDPNRGPGGPMTFQSDDPEAIRAEINALASNGVDGIKAVLQGARDEQGNVLLPTLSLPTLRSLAGEARSLDLWIAVHAGPLNRHVRQAVEAGATTIEHGVRMGNLITEESLALLLENEVVYVPTLGAEPRGYLNIPALYEAGVRIGVGTDAHDYQEELARLVEAGMPAQAVLQSATKIGAEALGRESEMGTIAEGKVADLLLVEGRPWENIDAIDKVALVIRDGQVAIDKRTGTIDQ